LIQSVKNVVEINDKYLQSDAHKEEFAKNRAIVIKEFLNELQLDPIELVRDFLREQINANSIRSGKWKVIDKSPDAKGEMVDTEYLFSSFHAIKKSKDRIHSIAISLLEIDWNNDDDISLFLQKAIVGLIDAAFAIQVDPLGLMDHSYV